MLYYELDVREMGSLQKLVLGTLFQNIAPWHIEYLKMKASKKIAGGRHLFFLESRNINPTYER